MAATKALLISSAVACLALSGCPRERRTPDARRRPSTKSARSVGRPGDEQTTAPRIRSIVKSINARAFDELAGYAAAGILPAHQLKKWRASTIMRVGKLLGRSAVRNGAVAYRFQVLYGGQPVHELSIVGKQRGSQFVVTRIIEVGW